MLNYDIYFNICVKFYYQQVYHHYQPWFSHEKSMAKKISDITVDVVINMTDRLSLYARTLT